MSGPCPVCGVDESELPVADAIATLRTLPRRYREALTGPAAATLARRPDDSTWSMLEYATHARELLDLFARALPTVLHTSRPSFPDIDVDEVNASRPAQPRDDVLDGIERGATTLATEAEAVPAAAWDRAFDVDGHERTARWLLQHAAHEGAHHLRDVERVRGIVAPRED